jgi:segregation and condensation protein A
MTDQPHSPESTVPGAQPDPSTSAASTPPAMEAVTEDSASRRKVQPREARPADRGGPDREGPFSVTVGQVYDGPYDLLLDLVRKQDIDIYDIPIARITAQFLAYVEHLKASDVDTAGEFIYMSALLIHIKSKMLLPRSPAESPEEAEDPRRELVERLLEHERFRNAAQMLQQKRQLEEATWTNPGMRDFRQAAEDDQDIAADTLDLVRVFREVLERAKARPVLDVSEDAVTVRQMIDYLRRRLMMEDRPVSLSKLLAHTRSVGALVAMFVAMLELVRLQAILLRQDSSFSEIYIKKSGNFEEVINDRLSVKDDWS